MDESPQSLESTVSKSSEFVQRYRLYLLGAAVFLLLILFLLLGLVLGRMQKDFERKSLEQRISLLQKNLQAAQDSTEENRRALEKGSADLADKDVQLARLAQEITARDKSLQACMASLAASAQLLNPVASPTAAAGPTPKPYLRFSNRECTLAPGKGEQNWRECIEDAKRKPKTAVSSSVQK